MKQKFLKLTLPHWMAIIAVTIIALPCLGNVISPQVAKEVGQWPAQVLLAAITMGALWFSYYSWKTALYLQEKNNEAQIGASKAIIEMTHELKKSNEVSQKTNELLEKRPCIVPTMANIIVKDQSQQSQ